ncbi:MAG: hypothetical protein AB7R89_04045 [Dehalococcoidia bacterium]
MNVTLARGIGIAALALAGGISSLLFQGDPAQASQNSVSVIRSGGGVSAADITAVVDRFRADLGGANNGANPPASSGRREINWDGVPDAVASPNAFPGNFFNTNSPRGAVFSTPGSSLQVSADSDNPTNTAARFGNIDPSYVNEFSAFSPQRLFTAVGSNVVDVHFFVPGTNTPATVRGFGSVFTDVELANTTIEYFNVHGQSLGRFTVPPSGRSGGFSFLGVSFVNPTSQATGEIARVRIVNGNAALQGGRVDRLGVDLVVMDDFIYSEPIAAR